MCTTLRALGSNGRALHFSLESADIDPSEVLGIFPADEVGALAWDDKEMDAAAARLRANAPASDTSFWEVGPQCNPSCGVVSWDAPDREGSPGVIHLTEMVKFVPVSRILARYGPDEAREAPLSPLGYPTHISWTKHRFAAGESGKQVISSDFRLLDGRTASPITWSRPIPEDHGTLKFEDVDAAFQVLRARQNRVRATDINVAVMERGVDLRGSRLGEAIAIEHGKSFYDVIAGDSGASRPTGNAVSNVESLFNTTSSHGTDVAQTVLGGVDGLRMHVLGSSPIFWVDDVERLGRDYAQWIREKDIRIVVSAVHQSFAISERRCAAFFHALFSGAEETLFVLSAGNAGLKDFAGCPLGHARRYENVLVVAGADPSGELNAASNYGIDTVDVAAPWCAEGRLFCGTSHAAPWVGNLAGRYLQKHPRAVPAEIVSAFYASCVSNRLVEVGCGGVVDPAEFAHLGKLGSKG